MVGRIVAILLLLAPALAHAETSFEQYKPNYIESEWVEGRAEPWLRFQVSYKFSLVRGDYVPRLLTFVPPGKLTLGYSQKSYWRIFDESAPFDEHNFNPELFYDTGAFKAGYEHQSTGVAGDGSKSWDRVFIETGTDHSIFQMTVRSWYVLATDSDTESIKEILGFGDYGYVATLVMTSGQWYRHTAQFTRGNFVGELGFRITRNSNWYLLARTHQGKGYSMVNHETHMETVSIGMALIP